MGRGTEGTLPGRRPVSRKKGGKKGTTIPGHPKKEVNL